MCIAIVKPAGAWVSKEHLQNSFRANPHGAGYAYFDEASKSVKMRKGFFSFRKFWRAYNREVSSEHAAILHFRIATAGKTDAANCHPFMIQAGALMHNGPCLNRDYCKGDDERSDTRQFAEDMVGDLTPKQIENLSGMIQDFIGYEKVAFLFTTGEFLICNENKGLWDGPKDAQCWYSNSSFRGYLTSTGRPLGTSSSGIATTTMFTDDDGAYDNWWERNRFTGGNYTGGKSAADALADAWDKDEAHELAKYSGNTNKLGLEMDGNLAIIKRFGHNNEGKHLVPVRWSAKLNVFLPSHLYIDEERLYWSEVCKGYAPMLKDGFEYIEDGDLIYMVPTGLEGSTGIEHVVGEVMQNVDHLALFVRQCVNYLDEDKDTPIESGGSDGESTTSANTQLVAIGGDQ